MTQERKGLDEIYLAREIKIWPRSDDRRRLYPTVAAGEAGFPISDQPI